MSCTGTFVPEIEMYRNFNVRDIYIFFSFLKSIENHVLLIQLLISSHMNHFMIRFLKV